MKTRTFFFFLIIPLIVLLAYVLKDYVRMYILAPVLYALRIERIIYEALPQAVWWGIFLLILLVIAIRTLMRSYKPIPVDIRNVEEQHFSRARTWSRWIWISRRGNYSKWLLARHFAELALNLQSYQERQSLEQIRAQILSGKADISPAILDYFQVGLDTPSFRHYSELLARLKSTRHKSSTLPLSPLNLDPEIIVQYLETKSQIGDSL